MTQHEYFGELPRFEKLEDNLRGRRDEVKKIGWKHSCNFRYPGEIFVKTPKPFHTGKFSSNGAIVNEFLVNLMLLGRDYPVIVPYGLYEVTVPSLASGLETDLVVPAFVSQFKKDGVSYSRDSPNNGWSIKHDEELSRLVDKAWEDGFKPHYDAHLGQNGLWVPSEGEFYMIDFEYWMGNEEEKDDLAKSLGFNQNCLFRKD